jgi:hypothetical protein
MKRVFTFMFVVCSTFFITCSVAKDIITYPWIGDDKYLYEDYYYSLLKLSLEKSTDKFGSFQLVKYEKPMNQGRAVGLVKNNKYINVMWTMTSAKRELQLQPIRVPLLKGLGGCRLFIIRKGEQSRFDKLTSESELKTMVAGQGDDWPDTQILRENDFRVMTGSSYNGVFEMLIRERFDYFPRALHEPWSEILSYDSLEVEKRFLLEYPSPYYFFVNKSNMRLHARIAYGLEKAMQDGSFNTFFNNHPVTNNILSKVNFANRTVYSLQNPLLSAESLKAFNDSKYSSVCRQ